jgi:hypothetical protein
MKRILAFVTVALLVFVAGGLAPREANAQGTCEYAATMSIAVSGAGAVGALGETVTNVLDRAVSQIEQAEAGGPEAAPASGDDGGAPPPRRTANEPPPLIAAC